MSITGSPIPTPPWGDSLQGTPQEGSGAAPEPMAIAAAIASAANQAGLGGEELSYQEENGRTLFGRAADFTWWGNRENTGYMERRSNGYVVNTQGGDDPTFISDTGGEYTVWSRRDGVRARFTRQEPERQDTRSFLDRLDGHPPHDNALRAVREAEQRQRYQEKDPESCDDNCKYVCIGLFALWVWGALNNKY